MSGRPAPAERPDVRAHIRRLVDDWPPLTPEQLDRLAILLAPVREAPLSTRAG